MLLFRNLGKGKFQDVTAEAGLAARNKPAGITFVDFDHDGDLDLFLTGAPLKGRRCAECVVAQQRQQDIHRMDGTNGAGRQRKTAAAILTDFNNDRAVDIAVTGRWAVRRCSISIRAKANIRRSRCTRTRSFPRRPGIAVLDFNKDGWMDIAVTHAGAPGCHLWRNVEGPEHVGRRFERVDCRSRRDRAAGA